MLFNFSVGSSLNIVKKSELEYLIFNSGGLGSTLLIDFGLGFNGFEIFTNFRVWVHWVSKTLSGSGRVLHLKSA